MIIIILTLVIMVTAVTIANVAWSKVCSHLDASPED